MLPLFSRLKSLLAGVAAVLLFVGLLVLANAGILKSLYQRFLGDSGKKVEDELNHVIPVDPADPAHERVGTAFVRVWDKVAGDEVTPDVWVVESNGINAASIGDHTFLFWEGVATLPDWAVDGIVAHEIAHDILLHVRKAEELSDLLNFLGETLGLFVGADRHSEVTIKEWMNLAALPSYSKSQELAADAEAVGFLRQAGYPTPRQTLANTLGILMERSGNTGGGFFDHHPSTSDRIALLTVDHAGAAEQANEREEN